MLAYGSEVGTILLIASLLISAYQLLSKKKPKVAALDDAITTSATQGAYIPLVIGRQRVGPVVIFVEDLTAGDGASSQELDGPRQAGQGEAGGKGGGGSPSNPSYVEMSLHAICVGPATELRAIYQNNELLWEGSLNPVNDPSGVTSYPVTEPDGTQSFFKVYWGFDDDAQIAELGNSVNHGIATNYSHSVKILWTSKRLGGTRQWPRLEYEIVCPCYSQISTSPSEVPRDGSDASPVWDDFPHPNQDPAEPTTDRVLLNIWCFDATRRQLVLFDGRECAETVENTSTTSGTFVTESTLEDQGVVDWESEFAPGGILKVWCNNTNTALATNSNTPVGFVPAFGGSPGTAGFDYATGVQNMNDDPLSQLGMGNGEWRYFRILSSEWRSGMPNGQDAVVGSRLVAKLTSGTFAFEFYHGWRAVRLKDFLVVSLGNEVTGSFIRDPQPAAPGTYGSPRNTDTIGYPGIGYCSPLLTSNRDGVNPIHIIDQVLFSRYPYGAGRNRAKFDSFAIDVAAEQLQAEAIRGGVAIRDGESVESWLSQIMQDIGLMIPLNPETGLYTFRLIRYETGGPTLGEDTILKAPQMEHVHGFRPIDRIALTFKDRDRNYREVPVRVDDNGQISENETVRAEKVPIEVTSDRDSISRIAPRRQQEALGSLSTHRFECNHRTILAVPGSRFSCSVINDPTLVFILTDIKRDVDSPKVVLDALLDTYDPPDGVSGNDGGSMPAAPLGAGGPGTVAAIDDVRDFFAIELPRALSRDRKTIELFVGASRKSTATRYGRIWLSRDGLTFELLENAAWVAQGTLQSELAATAPAVDAGPVLFDSDYQLDVDAMEDLSLDEAAWRKGRQVLLIGDEIIFLKDGAVTDPGDPCSGELSGLLRGRAGTKPATHAAGATFYVFLAHLALRQTSDMVSVGQELHYKVQAGEIRRVQKLDGLVAKQITPTGRALTPPEPSALRLGAYQTAYDATGGTIRFDWCYHSPEFPLTGLGTQPCGAACGISKPLGYFIVRVFDPDSIEVIEATTETPYLELDKTTRDAHSLDTGVAWTIEVEHVEGSFTSPTATLSIQSF